MKLKDYIDALKGYFTKFAIVGISGILVNLGVLALLKDGFDINMKLAGALAIEISIISNFLLNNFWTWKERRERSFWNRFVKYHMVTLISGVVNWIFLVVLTDYGLYYLLAQAIGIGAGMIINFFLNHHWTFKK